MQISALGHAEVGVRPNIVSGLIGVHLRSGWSWTGKQEGCCTCSQSSILFLLDLLFH